MVAEPVLPMQTFIGNASNTGADAPQAAMTIGRNQIGRSRRTRPDRRRSDEQAEANL